MEEAPQLLEGRAPAASQAPAPCGAGVTAVLLREGVIHRGAPSCEPQAFPLGHGADSQAAEASRQEKGAFPGPQTCGPRAPGAHPSSLRRADGDTGAQDSARGFSLGLSAPPQGQGSSLSPVPSHGPN